MRKTHNKNNLPLRATVIQRGEPAGVEERIRRRRMTRRWLSAVLVRHSGLICPSPLPLTVHRALSCPECTEREVRGRPGRTCRVLKGRRLPGRSVRNPALRAGPHPSGLAPPVLKGRRLPASYLAGLEGPAAPPGPKSPLAGGRTGWEYIRMVTFIFSDPTVEANFLHPKVRPSFNLNGQVPEGGGGCPRYPPMEGPALRFRSGPRESDPDRPRPMRASRVRSGP